MTDTLDLPKGYRFRFPGAAAPRVEDASLPAEVRLSLMHSAGALTQPRVQAGDAVQTGTIVAESDDCPAVKLVSPVTGKVADLVETRGKRRRLKPGQITIRREGEERFVSIAGASAAPDEIPTDWARQMLIDAGLWPSIRELPCRGPVASTEADPKAVVVKCVAAEPFTTRGHAMLSDRVNEFAVGLEMLQRAASGYARQHLILTSPSAPLAEQIREATKGKAWLSLHYAPVLYPVENDGYLLKLLFAKQAKDAEFRAWFVDVQTVVAIGACLSQGRPAVDRVVAVAGPSVTQPVHVRARIGTPIQDLLDGRLVEGEHRLVSGGLLTGRKVEDPDACLGPMDVAINALPEGREREFMGFVRPGADRDSFSPTFLSKLWPQRPRTCHTNLRGERRPCVSCGFCEEVCPADLMPHWLHKCLSTDRIEEAEQAGLESCIECGLCSYVCPSKIELRSELREGKAQVREEKQQA